MAPGSATATGLGLLALVTGSVACAENSARLSIVSFAASFEGCGFEEGKALADAHFPWHETTFFVLVFDPVTQNTEICEHSEHGADVWCGYFVDGWTGEMSSFSTHVVREDGDGARLESMVTEAREWDIRYKVNEQPHLLTLVGAARRTLECEGDCGDVAVGTCEVVITMKLDSGEDLSFLRL